MRLSGTLGKCQEFTAVDTNGIDVHQSRCCLQPRGVAPTHTQTLLTATRMVRETKQESCTCGKERTKQTILNPGKKRKRQRALLSLGCAGSLDPGSRRLQCVRVRPVNSTQEVPLLTTCWRTAIALLPT